MNLAKRLEIQLFRLMRRLQRREKLSAAGDMPPPKDPSIVLARVIGNDLWPRHALGQSLQNLAFILENEPQFAGTRKLFVLTRVIDPQVLSRAEAMVRDAGHEVLTLPFDPDAYSAQRIDTSAFNGDANFLDAGFAEKPDIRRCGERLFAASAKIRQAMDVNGGRNAALAWGQARADWTLVLDGSCFVSAQAFEAWRSDLTSQPLVPYLILPMIRLARNEDALVTPPEFDLLQEPQIGFSSLAKGHFPEAYPYGFRDKTALLEQIGVPGDWEKRFIAPWAPSLPTLPDRDMWKWASASVFRLSSGVDGGQLELPTAGSKRYESRVQGIFMTLAALDARLGVPDLERTCAILGVDIGEVTGR